jgi:hypothetical protein
MCHCGLSAILQEKKDSRQAGMTKQYALTNEHIPKSLAAVCREVKKLRFISKLVGAKI